jgi:uncharacterized phage-associated protein
MYRARFPKISAVETAHYILAHSGPMSHLKLQKLTFYVQAWHLAILEEELFEEDFVAWPHGPVCNSVWHEFKDPSSPLYAEVKLTTAHKRSIKAAIKSKLSTDQLEVIDDVLDEYGKRSSYYLECLTHEEEPWQQARKDLAADARGNASQNTISKHSMKKYYSSKIA